MHATDEDRGPPIVHQCGNICELPSSFSGNLHARFIVQGEYLRFLIVLTLFSQQQGCSKITKNVKTREQHINLTENGEVKAVIFNTRNRSVYRR
jgi:hypothetical protein